MTGFTVPLLFPYPQPTDPADAPAQIQALAEAVDAEMTDAENQLANITDPPVAWIGAGAQVIPNALGTTIVWSSEFFDNASMVDLVSSPTEIIIPSNGFYMISCEIAFEANGTGGRQLEILVNGVSLVNAFHGSAPPTTAPQGWSVNESIMRSCVTGDRISFRGGHTAGISILMVGAEAEVLRVSG
jgi:hypothetical protein